MQASADSRPGLIHAVFFSLHDSTAGTRSQLIDACHRYLEGHEGVLHFAVGSIAEAFDREVNVRDFDVSLLVIFADFDAHERYQSDPRHLRFVAENSANWKAVRVFDSILS
jgi:hypothetical protein